MTAHPERYRQLSALLAEARLMNDPDKVRELETDLANEFPKTPQSKTPGPPPFKVSPRHFQLNSNET
jgi:hypothetical protein